MTDGKADTTLLSAPLPHLRDLPARVEELRRGNVAVVLSSASLAQPS